MGGQNKLSREAIEKSAVDGTSPVPSLIFENTNLKGGNADPKLKYKNTRIDKNRDRKMDGIEENTSSMGGGGGSLGGYKSPAGVEIGGGMEAGGGSTKPDPIQMPLSFGKSQQDDNGADIKLDFFDTDLSQLDATGDAKSGSKQLSQLMQRTHAHAATAAPSSTAELNLKIQSVKKVWETLGSVMDGSGVGEEGVFTSTFDDYQVKPTIDSAGPDPDHPHPHPHDPRPPTEIVYSQCHAVSGGVNSYVNAQNMMKPDAMNSVSSNVCKLIEPQVKPQPASVVASAAHALSPPPPPGQAGGYTSTTQQPNSHIFQYAAGGMSGIPSPPTVVYNTSQPIPSQTTEIFQPTFQLSNPPVIGQSRSQFSPFTPYPITNQSMYFQTAAPPPPPPSSAGPPPPGADMYGQPYGQMGRQMGPPPPASHGFGQSTSSTGQLLISSATAASPHGMPPPVVGPKQAPPPPQQPIGTIGTKAYAQPTGNPMFVYDTMPAFMSAGSLLQRSAAAAGAQMQAANLAAAASSSYYSAAGAATAGPPQQTAAPGTYYSPASSNASHQQQYSAATVQFGQSPQTAAAANAASAAVSMQNFGSQLFRQPTPSSYLKSSSLAQQQLVGSGDPSKSPSANQNDVINSVFQQAASQMQSPKSRGGAAVAGGVAKQGMQQQQQPSPTQTHHKYTAFQVTQASDHYNYLVMQQVAAQQQRNNAAVAAAAAAQMGGGGVVGARASQVPPQQPPTRYNPTIQPPIARPPANYQQVAKMQQQQQQQQQMNNSNNNGNLQQHHHNNNGRLPPPQNRHPQQQQQQAGGRPGGPPPPGSAYVTKMAPNNANSYYPQQPGGGVKMDTTMDSKTEASCKMADSAAGQKSDLAKDDGSASVATD